MKHFLWRSFIALLLLIVFGGGTAYWLYYHSLRYPVNIQGNQLNYTIEKGATINQVAKDLVDQRVFNYPIAATWVLKARYQNKAHLLKAGEYAIPIGATPEQLLQLFIDGVGIQHTIRFYEGWSFKQMLAEIAKHPKIQQSLKGLNHSEIMNRLGYPNVHPEGRFYPDTYFFASGTSDSALLLHAYQTMVQKLTEAWGQRANNLQINNAYEALILASIIEKETGAAEEYAQVSGVFSRRLATNMRLQTDPTVIYGMGERYKGNITRADLRRETPYNTYVHKGLPPTPIAMPGWKALYAATHPDDGDSLYFVAKGKGRHYFSPDLKTHNCAVLRYQIKDKAPKKFRRLCQKQTYCRVCKQVRNKPQPSLKPSDDLAQVGTP